MRSYRLAEKVKLLINQHFEIIQLLSYVEVDMEGY